MERKWFHHKMRIYTKPDFLFLEKQNRCFPRGLKVFSNTSLVTPWLYPFVFRTTLNLCGTHSAADLSAPIPPRPKDALLDWDLLRTFECIVGRNMWSQFVVCLEAANKGWVHCGAQGLDWAAVLLGKAVMFRWCLVATTGPKVCRENLLHTPVRLNSWWAILFIPNFDLPNVAAEIESSVFLQFSLI